MGCPLKRTRLAAGSKDQARAPLVVPGTVETGEFKSALRKLVRAELAGSKTTVRVFDTRLTKSSLISVTTPAGRVTSTEPRALATTSKVKLSAVPSKSEAIPFVILKSESSSPVTASLNSTFTVKMSLMPGVAERVTVGGAGRTKVVTRILDSILPNPPTVALTESEGRLNSTTPSAMGETSTV